jgi:HK97 family phage portal protein
MANLLQRFVGGAFGGNKSAAPVVGHGGAGFDALRMFMPQSNIDYEGELRGKLHLNTLLAMGADYFASNIAMSPLIVEQGAVKGDKKDWAYKPDHPLEVLFANPNPYYTWERLAYGMAQSWLFDGNIYLLDWPDNASGSAGVYWLPHDLMEVHDDSMSDVADAQDGSKLVTYYRYYQPGGGYIDFHPSMILHLPRGFDLRDPKRGFSPVKAALCEIYGDNTASTYTSALVDNSGVPSLVFSPDVRGKAQIIIKDETQKKIPDMIKKFFSREGAGKSLWVPQGVVVQKLAFSPAEMDLGPLTDRLTARICGAMGFDPMSLGLPSANKTYANKEAADDAAYARVITPAKQQWAGMLTTLYLRRKLGEKNTRVAWDNSQVPSLQDDMLEVAKRATIGYKGGWMRRSEARALNRLESTPEDEVYITDVQAGMTQTDTTEEESPEDVKAEAKTIADKLRKMAAKRQFGE